MKRLLSFMLFALLLASVCRASIVSEPFDQSRYLRSIGTNSEEEVALISYPLVISSIGEVEEGAYQEVLRHVRWHWDDAEVFDWENFREYHPKIEKVFRLKEKLSELSSSGQKRLWLVRAGSWLIPLIVYAGSQILGYPIPESITAGTTVVSGCVTELLLQGKVGKVRGLKGAQKYVGSMIEGLISKDLKIILPEFLRKHGSHRAIYVPDFFRETAERLILESGYH